MSKEGFELPKRTHNLLYWIRVWLKLFTMDNTKGVLYLSLSSVFKANHYSIQEVNDIHYSDLR